MIKFCIWLLAFYFIAGIIAAFALKQTPYADNPLWAMVLLWPLYLVA